MSDYDQEDLRYSKSMIDEVIIRQSVRREEETPPPYTWTSWDRTVLTLSRSKYATIQDAFSWRLRLEKDISIRIIETEILWFRQFYHSSLNKELEVFVASCIRLKPRNWCRSFLSRRMAVVLYTPSSACHRIPFWGIYIAVLMQLAGSSQS